MGIRIGTAGWSIPKAFSASFPTKGTHLQRYARVFDAVEINSSFYRPHRLSTYQRWAEAVPQDFRFAVKVPRSITHERRLRETGHLLDGFLSEADGLGERLGVLLVQLPPSLAFEAGLAAAFLRNLTARATCPIVCEPRHRSWFTGECEALLDELRIARVAADPAVTPTAGEPGGWPGVTYVRLHGSPRLYYSPYDEESIRKAVTTLLARAAAGSDCWCVFDNTAVFAATGNALTAMAMARPMGAG